MSNPDHTQKLSPEARLQRIETVLILLARHLGLNPWNGERYAGDLSPPSRREQPLRGGN